jgi:hypothetical protein
LAWLKAKALSSSPSTEKRKSRKGEAERNSVFSQLQFPRKPSSELEGK